MEKKETPQRNLRRFFVVGREPEKVTFRFAERNASFNFSGTFRFADYKFRNKITWLNPDLITVSVTRNNGKFTDYQLWHRIKSNVAPMSRIVHQYNSSRGF